MEGELSRLWKDGKNIIFDVDVKGALSLKNKYPEKTLSIFIQPPSLEILIERLKKRATETRETLKTRIDRATLELNFHDRFDFSIVNDKLDITLQRAEELVNNFLG